MPGPEVKDWDMYHALRRKGHSKQSAARIANSHTAGTVRSPMRRRRRGARG